MFGSMPIVESIAGIGVGAMLSWMFAHIAARRKRLAHLASDKTR